MSWQSNFLQIHETTLDTKEHIAVLVRELRNWFQAQGMFKFYSSSILIMYEGDETENVEDLNVRVRWVDFAHTFPTEGVKDRNFQDGLSSLMEWLVGVSEESTTQQHKQQQHSFRDPR